MIRKLVLLDSFDIIWHAKITLHLVGPLKIYKWHVLSLKYMIKVIKKSKCLLITTALITLVSMHNRSEKKLYILYIIQYYNNQFHIIKKKTPSIHSYKKKNNRATCLHPFFRLSRKIRSLQRRFSTTSDSWHPTLPNMLFNILFHELAVETLSQKIISLLINQS